MKLPMPSSGYRTRVAAGRYTATRLHRERREALAKDIEDQTNAVKVQGRAWEDEVDAIPTRIAVRDACDDHLDGGTKEFRHKIASRSISAIREKPYTDVFHRGVDYYTAAPLSQNETRYRELLERVGTSMAGDADAKAFVDFMTPALEEFRAASLALESARNRAAMARAALLTAIDAWEFQMEKTYGLLVAELGRKGAERFFMRSSAATAVADDTAHDEETPA